MKHCQNILPFTNTGISFLVQKMILKAAKKTTLQYKKKRSRRFSIPSSTYLSFENDIKPLQRHKGKQKTVFFNFQIKNTLSVPHATTHNPQPPTSNLQPPTHNLQPTTHNPQPNKHNTLAPYQQKIVIILQKNSNFLILN